MLARRTRWHCDADIIVVGYGAGGAVAAITAHDCGAKVIVLEKQKADSHISTSFMAGGLIICPSEIKGATVYMESLYKAGNGLYWTEPDILQIWARYTTENRKWLENMGATMTLFRQGGEHKEPGMEAIDSYHVDGGGPGLMRFLYGQVKSRDILVLHNATANELLANSKGEIVGVKVEKNNDKARTINIQARRGVILATGGFEFDEQLKLQYLRVYPSYFLGSPANTGDGIRLALSAGAQLWHMNCVSGRLVMKFPDFPVAFNPVYGGEKWGFRAGSAKREQFETGVLKRHGKQPMTTAGFVIVDRSGKRFTNENIKTHTLYYELALFDSRRLLYPRVPSYWIFDQTRMNLGALVARHSGPAGAARFYQWNNNNRAELERGWIKQGDSVKQLAVKLGFEPRVLIETIQNYNLYCKNGEDPEFNRHPSSLIPMVTPPYYAIELWPGGPNTQGGPRRNSNANVLRPDGSEVPRLFAVGELGSIYGMLYPSGGGNLAECIAFGRIAGEKASENPPL